ncbi:uncharacterized protein [Diadema antillarum]|uniref:uncharacterized protein n=1 Tax=Diadema antillarum TaxID=105358 RepID=UPI003A85B5DD
MRGATRRKQNDLMHRQIKAFEATLQCVTERHDTGALYLMLTRVVPYNQTVNAVDEVHHQINRWYAERDGNNDDFTVSDRFMTFAQDIQYLKQMKSVFDERIYSVLFEFYYEMVMEEIPQAIRLVEKGGGAPSVRGSTLLVMSNIDNYAALQDSMPVKTLYDISKDCEKLFEIIHQLQQVDVSWGSLLHSGDVNTTLFDPDSLKDVIAFPNHKRFEAVLRLIPDLLRKIHRAVELSKNWWYQAERIRRRLRGQRIREKREPLTTQGAEDVEPLVDKQTTHMDSSQEEELPRKSRKPAKHPEKVNRTPAPRQPRLASPSSSDDEYDENEIPQHDPTPPATPELLLERRDNSEEGDVPGRLAKNPLTFPTVIETIDQRVKELSTSIALKQMDLVSDTNEVDFFTRRHQRIRRLRGNLSRTISATEAMHAELVGYRKMKQRLVEQLVEMRDPMDRRRLREKLKILEKRVKDIHELSEVIDYRHQIMSSDLRLELDIKDTFTRHMNEVQGRVEDLKSAIQEEKEERDRLEHELILLRVQTGLDLLNDVDAVDEDAFIDSSALQPRTRANGLTMVERTRDRSVDGWMPDLLPQGRTSGQQGDGKLQEPRRGILRQPRSMKPQSFSDEDERDAARSRRARKAGADRPTHSWDGKGIFTRETGESRDYGSNSVSHSKRRLHPSRSVEPNEQHRRPWQYVPYDTVSDDDYGDDAESDDGYATNNGHKANMPRHNDADNARPSQERNNMRRKQPSRDIDQDSDPHDVTRRGRDGTDKIPREVSREMRTQRQKKAQTRKNPKTLQLESERDGELSRMSNHRQHPRMYDPKRESIDSIDSNRSPSTNADNPRGREFDGRQTRQSIKPLGQTDRKKPRSRQPDLLSPFYQPTSNSRRIP